MNPGLKNRVAVTLLAIAMGVAGLATASADQGQFSLSGGSPYAVGQGPAGHGTAADMLSAPASGQYQNGPWVFKLTVPYAGVPASGNPEMGRNVTASTSRFGLAGSEAAATYNIKPGEASTFGINLSGKVRLNLADKFPGLGSGLNDYAAQADAYQNLDRFKALGSLGYQLHQDAAGINMNKLIYGSVGGSYQLNDQISGGVDFRLAQSPTPMEPGQRQVSAYVSHNLNNFKAKGYLLQDFSNGIEDRSVGAAVSYGF